MTRQFKLSARSLKALEGVHPHLVLVVKEGLRFSPVDFVVTQGLRSLEDQRKAVASGASKTLNSRHLTGHAVDIAPWVAGKLRWDWPLFYQIAPAMKKASANLAIPIIWGGDWRSFKDGPHFELDRKYYP